MKSIILVTPKLGIGGIQRAMTNLANYFINQGYSVTYISCKKEPLFYPLDKNVKLITPEFMHPGSGLGLLYYYLKIILYLRKNFKREPAKNIISFGDVFNPLTLIASRGLNKYVHISDRTSPDFKFKKYILFLKKITYPKSTTFIAQTTKAALWNKEKFRNALTIKIIPNPIRHVAFSVPETKEKIVLYVGRFAWEKNPKAAIDAFSKVVQNEEWKLVMLGDGPLLEEMKQYAKLLNVSDKVVFMGQVKNVDDYYAKASIFVLPSVLEGFPNALCEAMASGLPSVCFESIPYEDLGEHDKDFLVAKANDTLDFAAKIDRLIQSESLRIKIGAQAKSIAERLAMPIVFHKFEEILK